MRWAEGIFLPRNSLCPFIFPRDKSLFFFVEKVSVPSFFQSKKVVAPSFELSEKHPSNHKKWHYEYVQWWVVVKWTISKHTTQSRSCVKQESINNKKSCEWIMTKKVSAPSFLSSKREFTLSFFLQNSLSDNIWHPGTDPFIWFIW